MEQGSDLSFFLAIMCYIKCLQLIAPLLLHRQLKLVTLIVIIIQEQMNDACKLVNQSYSSIQLRQTFEKMVNISFCVSMVVS